MSRGTTALEAAGRPLRVQAVAKALVVLGLAAAALALFAMAVPIDLDAEAPATRTDTRTLAAFLLLSATAQVHAAVLALLVPKRALACMVAAHAGRHAYVFIWRIADAGAHGQFQGSLNFYYWLFVVVQLAGLAASFVISIFGEE